MSNILDSFKLNGKTAIVTGAARGLGQGMSLALAEAGADIVAVDILPADDTKKQVEAMGRKCLTIAGNLGDRTQIPGIIEQAKKRATQIVDEARDQARSEADRVKAQAQAEIEQEINGIKDALRTQVGSLAVSGAEKILRASIDQSAHAELVDKLAAEI